MATKVESNQLTDYWEDAATQTLPDYSEQTSTGFAQDGNPVTGQKATLPGAAWFNIMAAVRVSVILAAGKTPSNPPDPLQFLEALQSLGWMTSESVKTDVLADESVTTEKLADHVVTIAKIATALLATKSQAEAGTADDVLMTPLRVKQAIEKALEEDLPKASETQLGGVKVTGDDGITINGSGEIAVDFSQMPTDKFEDLLKSIRVPIWLTKNTNFYVNSATGNDSNNGLTPETAFKTIQAAYNYIADNYNLSSYNATIQIADGTYSENLTLGSYSSNTGSIIITGNAANKNAVVLEISDTRARSLITASQAAGTTVVFKYMTLSIHSKNLDTSGNNDAALVMGVSGNLNFENVTVNYYASNRTDINQTIFYASDNCSLVINPGNFAINMIAEEEITESSSRRCFYITGRLTFGNASADTPLENSFTVSGNFTEFIRVNGGYVYRNTTRAAQFASSGTVTGQRYIVRNNGGIATNGGGPDFFPGDRAGSLDTSTYCWYS